MGEMIEFRGNGHVCQAYLAIPESGRGPGVIVLQEWWGLVGHIKSVADRFAAAGFLALAPDLYHGEVAEEPDSAGKLMMALNISETEKTLRGAVEALLGRPECGSEKAGVVGFCMGGQLSMFAAATNPETIGACVNFYGIHPNVHPPFEQMQAAVLGFFAEHDAFTNAEVVHKLGETLEANGIRHSFTTFPGTHHAFFNDGRPQVYDGAAAALCWEQIIAFFGQELVSRD